MVRIQQGSDENLFCTLPKRLAESKAWKKGDEIAFMIVGPEVVPQNGDIVVRKVYG